LKRKQTYLAHCLLCFVNLILLCGAVTGQNKITYEKTYPEVPKVLLGSWVDEDGIYRIEIQKEFCGVNNQLWKYINIEEKEGGYYIVVENENGDTKDFSFSISNTGKISLDDRYLFLRTLFLSSDAFSDSFRKIKVGDLPENITGVWRSNSSSDGNLKISTDGITQKDTLWKFHQIILNKGEYRIILKHRNTYLLWVPKWNKEGKLSDVFKPDDVMIHQDSTVAYSNFGPQDSILTKSLNGNFVFNAPADLQINQMPPKFFGN